MPSRYDEYPKPAGNRPRAVERAVEVVLGVQGESRKAAYDGLLYAVGNNHAGSYFPVVVPVVEALTGALATATPLAQAVILDCLIDLLSFEPDHRHKTCDFGRGQESVQLVLREAIVVHLGQYEMLRAGSGEASRIATELLWALG